MPYIKNGRWQVPSRDHNPVIHENNCSICGCFVAESDRVFEMRATGLNGSLQRWTFCSVHAPREGPKIETSLVNRSSLEM